MDDLPTAAPRPPSDRGQGRKPISESGEIMRNRTVRMTDDDWADCGLVAGDTDRSDWIRGQIAKAKRAMLRAQSRG